MKSLMLMECQKYLCFILGFVVFAFDHPETPTEAPKFTYAHKFNERALLSRLADFKNVHITRFLAK